MSRISCSDFRKFLDPYLDGEFDDRERADFDAHLAHCSDCRRYYEKQVWFQRALRPALSRPEPMPPGARARLRFRLTTASRPSPARLWFRRLALPVPALAGAAAIFLVLTPLTGFVPVVGEAVDQHCQTLPVEVPTPEAAEVDEWFEGKVPFHMSSPRFRDDRVSLLGARLTRVGGRDGVDARRAAYLIYGVGHHKVSVLVFDGRDLDLDHGEVRRVGRQRIRLHDAEGYRVATYRKGPLTYAVTSELPSDEVVGLIATSL